MAETRIKVWTKFSNGTIEATAYDTSGPLLFGGPINGGEYYPYRRLRNLSGLLARRMNFGEKYIPYPGIRLITVGDLVLDVPNSRFPSPPGEQVQVYKGTVKLISPHIGIYINATVAVRYPSSPLPDENTPISGKMRGEQESPIFPILSSRVNAGFDSKYPVRYGEETASYEVNNFLLIGELIISKLYNF